MFGSLSEQKEMQKGFFCVKGAYLEEGRNDALEKIETITTQMFTMNSKIATFSTKRKNFFGKKNKAMF